ncbi:MAG: VTT domain-containing protein [bacterium]
MHTVKLLTILVEHNQVLAYLLIFIGLIFEGEVVLISTGILSHLGALNPYFAICFVLCGAFIKTIIGYYMGTLIHERWHNHKFLKYIEKKVDNIMPRFRENPFWSIFISKFIIGFNHIIIIFAGYSKINYRQYLKAEISSTIIWAPLLLSLGYFFSFTALHVSKEIWRFSLIILIFVVGYILFDKLVGWLYELFEEFYADKKQ